MSAEAVLITLGGSIVKSALSIWLGSNKIAVGLAGTSVDIATKQLTGLRERRRFGRMIDEGAETVASRLEPLIRAEYRELPENERLAAIEAVSDTLDRAALNDRDLFAADLDAGRLYRQILITNKNDESRAGLSPDAHGLYELILRETCSYILQFGTVLPQTGIAGLGELLRRDTHLNELVRDALDRLPVRRGADDFERDYRQLVANRLDQVEFFGATLSDSSRRYPLSVAYLSVTG